jgi:hypothetical protein
VRRLQPPPYPSSEHRAFSAGPRRTRVQCDCSAATRRAPAGSGSARTYPAQGCQCPADGATFGKASMHMCAGRVVYASWCHRNRAHGAGKGHHSRADAVDQELWVVWGLARVKDDCRDVHEGPPRFRHLVLVHIKLHHHNRRCDILRLFLHCLGQLCAAARTRQLLATWLKRLAYKVAAIVRVAQTVTTRIRLFGQWCFRGIVRRHPVHSAPAAKTRRLEP